MPTIKKSNLTQQQVLTILNAKVNSPIYSLWSPKKKFEEIIKRNHRKVKYFATKKHHYKAIVCNGEIHLLSGVGKEIGVFEDSSKGIIKAREISRNIFLNTPEEQRNGGYYFDYFKEDLVRIDLTLGFSN